MKIIARNALEEEPLLKGSVRAARQ